MEEVSDDLLVRIRDEVEADGFHNCLDGDAEAVALKVLSATTVKMLAMVCERSEHQNLAVAYLKMVPEHAELVRKYLVKEIERRLMP